MLKRSIAMACNLESYVIMLWRVISVKLDTDKKITGSEIMTLNYKKIWHVSALIELIFMGELHC